MRFALGFVSCVAIAMIVGLTIMFTGAYNVAASEPHAGIVRWVLDTTFHNSVRARSDEQTMQPTPAGNTNLRAGFREFQEYCVHCHGAPGVKRAEWASGMTPMPPNLSRAAKEWSPDEIFWIVKHGVKMTGMPPFGDTESDQTIRNIAAFVDRLPEISPAEFSRMQQAWGTPSGHQHGAQQSPEGGQQQGQ